MFHEGWEVAIGIASVIATVVLVIFVIKQTKHTQTSLELTRHEIDSRLRPWVGRANPGVKQTGVTLEDNRRLNHDTFLNQAPERSRIKTYHMRLIAQNYGQLPAQNCIMRSSMRRNEPPTQEHLDPLDSVKSITVLMPSESIGHELLVPADLMHDMLDQKNQVYVLFRVDYEYENNKWYYEMIGEILQNNIVTIKSKAG